LNGEIKTKNLDVQLVGNCELTGDSILLERALLNLVHNAVRYNVEAGKITIELSHDEITITDTGVGMNEKDLQHIFEPFYCADKSRSKKLGGNGLGMSIVKTIFDRHNIQIKITSEVNVGTTIRITF
jgi:signal transduction histidine kinase